MVDFSFLKPKSKAIVRLKVKTSYHSDKIYVTAINNRRFFLSTKKNKKEIDRTLYQFIDENILCVLLQKEIF